MARTIQRQLLDAFEGSNMTLGELLRLSALRCSEDSLSRKLRGRQSLRAPEIERLANALRVEVTAGRAA